MNNNEKAVIIEFFQKALEKQYVSQWAIDDQVNELKQADKPVPRALSNSQSNGWLKMSSWSNVILDADLWDEVHDTNDWWKNLNNQYGGNRG